MAYDKAELYVKNNRKIFIYNKKNPKILKMCQPALQPGGFISFWISKNKDQ